MLGAESHSKGTSVTAEEVMMIRFTVGVCRADVRTEVLIAIAGVMISRS